MNKLIFLFLLFTLNIFSQSNFINYQAVIRDTSNQPLANKNFSVRISVSSDTFFINPSYIEVHRVNTNINGLFNIAIGSGNPLKNTYDSIKWDKSKQYVKTEIDVTGGVSFKHFSTTEMKSVPYALHSKTADYCKTAESIINSPQKKRYIGENYGGGVVFHLEYDSLGNEHGLIVGPNNLLPSEKWSNVTDLIGNSLNNSYDGMVNSLSIVNQAGHDSSAAKKCLKYIQSGYNDWYLPSIDELRLLANQRFNVNKTLSNISGSTILRNSAKYWSSTEGASLNAYYHNFEFNITGVDWKDVKMVVRPIRKF